MASRKILLDESEIPTHWYNIVADMPNKPLPPLHPGTQQPVGPEDLAPLFPMELIKQEVTQERWVEIPDEVRNLYSIWRPTPMYRALGLEKALNTKCKIYYKYEGTSPAGSHKPNTAIPQAYYNAKEGVKKISTETGAGQWGSALSFACSLFNIDCEVYMVKVSYDGKPYRKIMMNTWGSKVHPSPTNLTNAGRQILAQDPNSPGSLGIAISEAVEVAAMNEDTKYALGSVLNHVLMHQTIIGLEAMKQMEKAGDYPDIIVAPFGGGSNFAGITFPFLQNNLTGGPQTRAVAVEPTSCPKLTRGVFRYDFGDTVGMTPLIPMYTLGHNFIPSPIHAGGLRYHGAGAIISQLLKDGLIEADAINQNECFEAGILFSKTEGIIPAPEATHAIAEVIRQVKQAEKEGVSKTILFNLCGHGNFDLGSYEQYLAGKLVDFEVTQEQIDASLAELNTPTI
ncbi:TrpB-like pyridoxal phosphate-dependent enzyme [Sandaracinomonas limnophila]|uniref:Tryptophan synthase beta chain n=1 Tax=Sandaracinomonas limnophila TaxID=1862386 RepID=A0A437PS22_9BACT|nr:TrpB-like pyridoxal phosphate-dependent enzyme [Sandaracinomonas limnophila]RVU25055.1 TrpB-like pyridoxal phosphate-dependent enzyme [Sandaracinomonas limnophila]